MAHSMDIRGDAHMKESITCKRLISYFEKTIILHNTKLYANITIFLLIITIYEYSLSFVIITIFAYNYNILIFLNFCNYIDCKFIYFIEQFLEINNQKKP